jgi:hypothetical protein
MKTFIREHWWYGSVLSIPPWGLWLGIIGTSVQLIGLIWLAIACILLYKNLKQQKHN